jgi:hypothetical protein
MFMIVQSARRFAQGGFYAASAHTETGAAAFIRGSENGALSFCPEARLLERFRAKWAPVRVKKTRQNKRL